ncbi:hypothetical protein [Streptomyces sp. WAC06614]|uniref:hypothetical protein n=1 Tax=Streptomyces sp. WAC06614 TaxID=2487416 RepID=UPI00163C2A0A|nr:hypothetical protein [Streptomyces sp. WAC06614]
MTGTQPGGTGGGGTDDELSVLHARVAELEAKVAAGGERPKRHRVRHFWAAVLIVLGCILAPLSLVATWTADIVGNTDRYVDTVAPLASDADVQAAVANRATDAVMQHIDLNSLLEDVAPDDRPRLTKALGKLSDPIENAVRSFVHDKALDVVSSDAFEKVWTEANRKIHASVDKALTGSGGGAVKINQNTVTLDLAPVIEQVKQRLVDAGLGVAGKIPEIHTDFTLVKADDIGRLKTGFRLLQLVGTWLPVLGIILLAVGIWLSEHRRRALVAAALGVAFAVVLLGVGLTVFRVIYLDALPEGVSQPAAGSVYDTLVRFLRQSVRTVAALGVVIAVSAWLTGPGRRAGVLRGMWHSGIGAARTTADRAGLRTGPVGPFVRRRRTWIVWILVAAAVLTYVLWSYPTGLVVLALALALLFALAIVDFLAQEPAVGAAAPGGPVDGGPTHGGPAADDPAEGGPAPAGPAHPKGP